jgi:flagella basal body P-ring formation protein FlgA
MTFIFSNRISQSALTLTAFICFTLIAFADRVHASRTVTGADIADAIVQTLELEGEEAGPKILATKKYFPCDAPLEILPMFGSWKTVRVNCASPIPWKLIVRAQWPPEPQIEADAEEPKQEPAPAKTPVKRQKIKPPAEMFNVVMLTRSVSKGDILTKEDILVKSVREAKARGMIEDPARAIGRKMRQSVSSRRFLKPRHLEKNWMIEKDDIITMRVNTKGIEVLGVGIAQEPGQLGEIIRMRNASSGVLLRVKVTGDKNVDVISKTAR